jgi:hypothetical protein
VSVVDVPLHETNANTAMAVNTNFFIPSVFQNLLNSRQ